MSRRNTGGYGSGGIVHCCSPSPYASSSAALWASLYSPCFPIRPSNSGTSSPIFWGPELASTLPIIPKGTTVGDARSRDCTALFPDPIPPSTPTLTQTTRSAARNCSLCTTSPTHHLPRCSRRRKAKAARVRGSWRSGMFGTSERSCSAPAKTKKMTIALLRTRARGARSRYLRSVLATNLHGT